MPIEETPSDPPIAARPTPAPRPRRGDPTPALEQRRKAARFWHRHPLLFGLALALVAFTSYMQWRDSGPGDHSGDDWYLALCGVLIVGLGVYLLTPAGARRQAEYDRDPNRLRPWLPMPKSITGVRVLGIAFVVLGLAGLGMVISGF